MALAEGARGVFDTTGEVYFRVTGCGAAPLTELCELIESELACQCQLGIEHGGHVTGIEEETVATFPIGVLGVVLEELAIEYVDEIGTAHSTTGVTRLCLFYH